MGSMAEIPDIRILSSGTRIGNLRIATTESWTDKLNNTTKDKTELHNVIVINDFFIEIIDKHVKKGTNVYIEGNLQTRKWIDNFGKERSTIEIICGARSCEFIIVDKINNLYEK
jgi:single-strand DNA-binding protein